MQGSLEKRLRLGVIEVGLTLDPGRAERLRRSLPYRALARPALAALARRGRGDANGSATAQLGLPSGDPAQHRGDGSPEAAALWERVAGIRWYHTIDLPHGVVTPGFVDRRHVADRYGIPADLSGKRCLDVGAWDGFWSFELEKRGAAEVVGLDVDSPLDLDFPRLQKLELQRRGMAGLREVGIETIGAGFAVAHAARGSKVKREVCRLYELSPERLGHFDFIFCSEVLEHLRDPQTALENLFSVTKPGGVVLIAEPFNPDLEWFGRTMSVFVGTTNNIGVWWEHSTRSLRKMMAVAGYAQIDEAARLEMDNKLGRFSKIVLRGSAPASPTPEPAGASRVSEPTAKEEGLTNAVDA